jgi:hypothetical protein
MKGCVLNLLEQHAKVFENLLSLKKKEAVRNFAVKGDCAGALEAYEFCVWCEDVLRALEKFEDVMWQCDCLISVEQTTGEEYRKSCRRGSLKKSEKTEIRAYLKNRVLQKVTERLFSMKDWCSKICDPKREGARPPFDLEKADSTKTTTTTILECDKKRKKDRKTVASDEEMAMENVKNMGKIFAKMGKSKEHRLILRWWLDEFRRNREF